MTVRLRRRFGVQTLAAFAVVLMLAGCRSYAANTVTLNAGGGAADIQVVNEGLQDDLELTTGQVAYEQDILVGWVRIRNREDDKVPFEYRWRWWDSGDKEVKLGGGTEAWLKGYANPLDEEEVDGRAPAPGAVRAEFQLRYAAE